MSKAKKKAAPKKVSTALAVVKKTKAAPAPVLSISDPHGMMARQSPIGQLGELATVGALGLAEIKLTDKEEAVLSRAVDPAQIMLKPAKRGEPPSIPYLPHIFYTRWFNDAFGRTGWSIVPTAAPKKVDNLVLVPYLLYIHGVPVAAATGEQEYIESNRQQTYGDVIESTVASALRRCAKRLGVGLEMWDRAWLEVNTPKKGRPARVAPRPEPLDAEPVHDQVGQDFDQAIQDAEVEVVSVLSKEQWARLSRIAEKAGRSPADVNLYLRGNFNKDLKKIERRHYDAIVKALEGRGALPMPGDGE